MKDTDGLEQANCASGMCSQCSAKESEETHVFLRMLLSEDYLVVIYREEAIRSGKG